MAYIAENIEEQVYFEAVLRSETGESMFAPDTYLEPDNLQQFAPAAGRAIQAATTLQSWVFASSKLAHFLSVLKAPENCGNGSLGQGLNPGAKQSALVSEKSPTYPM
jgi:hypothetical protein